MTKLKGKAKDRKRRKEQKRRQGSNLSHKDKLRSMIRLFDDPVLKQECEPVQKGEDLAFINDLKRVLAVTSDGVGLAANQIGVVKRAIAIRLNTHKSKVDVMINPDIVEEGKDEIFPVEGCLSFPGCSGEVRRLSKIKVEYLDEKWVKHSEWKSGPEAVIVQHEIDHLNGACAVGDIWEASNQFVPAE
jgi:peptide deformylase